jgi:hypothetical protein
MADRSCQGADERLSQSSYAQNSTGRASWLQRRPEDCAAARQVSNNNTSRLTSQKMVGRREIAPELLHSFSDMHESTTATLTATTEEVDC